MTVRKLSAGHSRAAVHTNEPTAVVTSHTRPVKVQAASNHGMKRGVGDEVPLLASDILVIVSRLERERQFSLSNQILAVG